MNYIAQDKKAIFLTNNPDFGSQTHHQHGGYMYFRTQSESCPCVMQRLHLFLRNKSCFSVITR